MEQRAHRHLAAALAVFAALVLGLVGAESVAARQQRPGIVLSSNQVAPGASFLATVTDCQPTTVVDVTLSGQSVTAPCDADGLAYVSLTAPSSPREYEVAALTGQVSVILTVRRSFEPSMSVESPVTPGETFAVRISDCQQDLPITATFGGNEPSNDCPTGTSSFTFTAPNRPAVYALEVQIEEDPTTYLGHVTVVDTVDAPGPVDPGLPGTGPSETVAPTVLAAAAVGLGAALLTVARRRR